MLIGKVVGSVVATRKDERLDGKRLLLLQPLRSDHTPVGDPIVAVDSAGEVWCSTRGGGVILCRYRY